MGRATAHENHLEVSEAMEAIVRVGGADDGRAPGLPLSDQFLEQAQSRRVEMRLGLIEQDQVSLQKGQSGESKALFHARGKGIEGYVLLRPQTHPPQHRFDVVFLSPKIEDRVREDQILVSGQASVEAGGLVQVSHQAAHGLPAGHDVDSLDSGSPEVGNEGGGEAAKQRGFAGTIISGEEGELAPFHRETRPREGPFGPKLLRQVLHEDERPRRFCRFHHHSGKPCNVPDRLQSTPFRACYTQSMSVLRLIPLKGEAIVVDADEALVGREANCNVVVSHPSVSRRHAVIKRKQDVFFVVDQGSANGTFVDSKRIVDAALKDGCVLRFGSASFKAEVRDELPVESIAEDELVVAQTMVGEIGPTQSFSATVLEGAILSDDMATPHYGTDIRNTHIESPPPPAAKAARPAEPRAQAPSAYSSPPAAVVAPAPAAAAPAAAPNRGPAFWLMIGAAALALLFVGAAVGLGAAFLARRMGWL